MSDVAKWKVRGAVATLRTEFATWNADQQDWEFAAGFTSVEFRPDGKIVSNNIQNPDGSVEHSRWLYDAEGRLIESQSWINDGPVNKSKCFYDDAGRHGKTVRLGADGSEAETEVCSYDDRGRKTKVRSLGGYGANTSFGIEGTDVAYGADGAVAMRLTYDDNDLPTEAIFEGADRKMLRRIVFKRDRAGRLLAEDMRTQGTSLLPDILANMPPEQGAAMAAVLESAFGETFSNTTYEYDDRGRLVERTHSMGKLGGDRTIYRYSEGDDPMEEITENSSREANMDESGIVTYSSDRVDVQHNRLEYRYDPQGNWTERIVSIRPEGCEDFQPSNIERRMITYHVAG